MANFIFSRDKIEFKINGNDRTASAAVIFLLITAVPVFLFTLYILSETEMIVHNLIFSAVLLFAVTFVYISLIIYFIKTGLFARYIVKLNPDKIEIYDKKNSTIILSDSIDTDNLYISDFRQQAGYASIMIKALCYGPIKQIITEDRMPSGDFVLLCTGPERKISALKDRILDIIRK